MMQHFELTTFSIQLCKSVLVDVVAAAVAIVAFLLF
jgi:hypothetical protein